MKRIAFLTDVHLNEQLPKDQGVSSVNNFRTVLENLRQNNIKHIVFGGDIGDPSALPLFFDALMDFELDLVLGNHDSYAAVVEHYKKVGECNELFYAKQTDAFKFIFLDSSSGDISLQQLAWLQDELRTHEQIVIFVHHPVLEIDTPVDALYPLKNRLAVKSMLLESQKKITIFSGHYHMSDERVQGKIKQIITPALSFQIVKDAETLELNTVDFGYRIIDFDPKEIKTEYINFQATN